MITFWHNPRCSKSRAALTLLEEHGALIDLIKYLETPPSRDELAHVMQLLGLPASAIIRTGEATYKSLNLAEVDSEEALLDAMAENPILIERPIAMTRDRAIIGRPPENVLALLT